MRAYNALKYMSGFLTGLAFLPPLVASFAVSFLFRVSTNRGHDRSMLLCGICWSPILVPSWLLMQACDMLADKIKPLVKPKERSRESRRLLPSRRNARTQQEIDDDAAAWRRWEEDQRYRWHGR